MTDLRERFQMFDEVPVPDLWDRIGDLAEKEAAQPRTLRPRIVVAASAVVVLLLVGAPLLLIGGADRSETTTEFDRRELAPVDPPWDGGVTALQAMEDGGFVAVPESRGGVLWSPDGRSWYNADPNRLVAARRPHPNTQMADRVTTASDSHVGIRNETDSGLWIGVPSTGKWELTRFDQNGSPGELQVLTLAANDTEFLVVARALGSDVLELDDPEKPLSIKRTEHYLVMIFDPVDRSARRTTLPIEAEWALSSTADAVWFNEQWLIVIERNEWVGGGEGWTSASALLASSDGSSFTQVDWPLSSVTSLTAGANGLIATVCNFGGDTFWYSPDGTNWEATTSEYLGHRSTYVERLGFVVAYEDSFSTTVLVSKDGRTWLSPAEHGLIVEPYPGEVGLPSQPIGELFAVESEMLTWRPR